MDDGLVLTNARAYDYCKAVLILVVVDDGLVPHKDLLMCVLSQSLNPYCSGRWSRTEAKKIKKEHKLAVLILIVVEDGLVLFGAKLSDGRNISVLILIVVEDGLVHL